MKELIQEYSRDWPVRFEAIRERLGAVPGDHFVTIHHVGSTAVPGLAAKPVIDIDIEIADRDQLPAVIRRLERLGYFHNGDQGIPGREAMGRRRTSRGDGATASAGPVAPTEATSFLDTTDHNLYVCATSARELCRHLLLRDYLWLHPEDRDAYAALKKELAAQAGQIREVYVERKEAAARRLIEGILA